MHEKNIQRVIDGVLDDYFESSASKYDITDIMFNNVMWWRTMPVPESSFEKKNLQFFMWRYTNRLMLHRKIMAIARIIRRLDDDDCGDATKLIVNLPVKRLIFELTRNDEYAWTEFLPEPGTHFGLLMSQIICGPLTQAYLDQAHGGDVAQPTQSFEDSNFKILNTTFMGYKFKDNMWNYYKSSHAVNWNPKSDDESVQWILESLIIEKKWPNVKTASVPGRIQLELTTYNENDAKIFCEWARNMRIELARDIEFVPPNVLAVAPRFVSSYGEFIVDTFKDLPDVEFVTINTVMYHARRSSNPLILYDFYYDKINNFLNPSNESWFSIFLSVFVNIVCKKNGIVPLNRRSIGVERDLLTSAAFECPYDIFLQKAGTGEDERDIWPIAASIIGTPGRLHGTEYKNFKVTVTEEERKKRAKWGHLPFSSC